MEIDAENPQPRTQAQRDSAASEQQWGLVSSAGGDEDAYLRDLTGTDDLSHASTLRIAVNTRTATISHLGRKLPMLHELNLGGSVLESIRELGTGFARLQVLWVPRCGLDSLDGLAALPALRELYAAYNDVSDLQPLADSCPRLEVLDLECNRVAEVGDLEALATGCPGLVSLCLTGCPVASASHAPLTHGGDRGGGRGGVGSFRGMVRKLLPSLRMLDDAPLHGGDNGGGEGEEGDDIEVYSRPSEGVPRSRVVAGGGGGPLQSGNMPLIGSTPTGGSRSGIGGGGGAMGPEGGDANADPELMLIQEGIKRARVGVDSHDFRELEMALIVVAATPANGGSDGGDGNNVPPLIGAGRGGAFSPRSGREGLAPSAAVPTLQQQLAAASATMLPVSASSWLRCSQQGSLPGLQAAINRSSLHSGVREGGGGDSRCSTASSGSRPTGGDGTLRTGSVPSTSYSSLQQQQDGGVRRAVSGNGANGRPMTSRPFSARPNAHQFAAGGGTNGGRPPTGAAGSAPPTASPSGGGLFWRKNRVGTSLGQGRDAWGTKAGGGDGEDDGPEGAASSLTCGGDSSALVGGGGLARDLRRRRKLVTTPPGVGGGPSLLSGSNRSNGSRPDSGCREGAGIAHGDGGGRAAGGAASTSSWGGEATTVAVRASYDSASLLEELRKWKVATADCALMPAEDEASGPSLLSGGGGGGIGTSGGVGSSSLMMAWPSALAEEDEEEGGASFSSGRADGRGGTADVLSIGSEPDPTSASWDATEGDGGVAEGGGDGPGRMLLGPKGTLFPAGWALAAMAPGLLPPPRASSPMGRPPLSPISSLKRGGGLAAMALDVDIYSGGSMGLSESPSSLRQSSLSKAGAGGGLGGAALAPVQGPKPSRPSKMPLCKALQDVTGRVICSTAGAGLKPDLDFHNAVGGRRPSSTYEIASPLQRNGAVQRGDASLGKGTVYVICASGEIDILSVNPMPAVRGGDEGGGGGVWSDDEEDGLLDL